MSIRERAMFEMEIRERAMYEMERANFSETYKEAVRKILDIFFETWDSGDSVWVMSKALNRLICGKCLSPLTGEDEWTDVGPFYQNKRISSVFKEFTGEVYDIDNPKGAKKPITFPYYPEEVKVSSPVIEI